MLHNAGLHNFRHDTWSSKKTLDDRRTSTSGLDLIQIFNVEVESYNGGAWDVIGYISTNRKSEGRDT